VQPYAQQIPCRRQQSCTAEGLLQQLVGVGETQGYCARQNMLQQAGEAKYSCSCSAALLFTLQTQR
jgi:hypothetical protein